MKIVAKTSLRLAKMGARSSGEGLAASAIFEAMRGARMRMRWLAEERAPCEPACGGSSPPAYTRGWLSRGDKSAGYLTASLLGQGWPPVPAGPENEV